MSDFQISESFRFQKYSDFGEFQISEIASPENSSQTHLKVLGHEPLRHPKCQTCAIPGRSRGRAATPTVYHNRNPQPPIFMSKGSTIMQGKIAYIYKCV